MQHYLIYLDTCKTFFLALYKFLVKYVALHRFRTLLISIIQLYAILLSIHQLSRTNYFGALLSSDLYCMSKEYLPVLHINLAAKIVLLVSRPLRPSAPSGHRNFFLVQSINRISFSFVVRPLLFLWLPFPYKMG